MDSALNKCISRRNNMKIYIGIDPGKSGGVSILSENTISAHRCPENEGDMYAILKIAHSRANLDEIAVIMEHVWAFPSDSSKAAFTFGRNFGSWITALEILELKYELVRPKKWQTFFNTPKMEKKERKRWLKEKAQNYVDNSEEPFRVTFNTSDAILIGLYCKNENATDFISYHDPGDETG